MKGKKVKGDEEWSVNIWVEPKNFLTAKTENGKGEQNLGRNDVEMVKRINMKPK
jgi:hypothetical protein